MEIHSGQAPSLYGSNEIRAIVGGPGSRSGSPRKCVRIEKLLCMMLHEAHRRQVEKAMNTLSERPEGLYKTSY